MLEPWGEKNGANLYKVIGEYLDAITSNTCNSDCSRQSRQENQPKPQLASAEAFWKSFGASAEICEWTSTTVVTCLIVEVDPLVPST